MHYVMHCVTRCVMHYVMDMAAAKGKKKPKASSVCKAILSIDDLPTILLAVLSMLCLLYWLTKVEYYLHNGACGVCHHLTILYLLTPGE